MTHFCKHNPPSFEGTFNVQATEDWINLLEKIFKVLDCSSERKAQMVIYRLEKDADRWWKNTEILLDARNTRVTWEVFLEHFCEKYFQRSIRDEREAEFLTLKQRDDELFDEYLAKFICLSNYSSYLRYGNDERWMIEKMVRGLRQSLREMIAPRQFKQFNKVVEAC
ncbi:uncharacterized protein LOC114726188 [Neltuma alba]|uniref:uncharacterized protein LOC114726188 n=1 Tax=Neltuma alba TaxID=207710 RepID=UPI0010A301CE|nr:uncharacterized protein LOC114726188 [Prosopis alba]